MTLTEMDTLEVFLVGIDTTHAELWDSIAAAIVESDWLAAHDARVAEAIKEAWKDKAGNVLYDIDPPMTGDEALAEEFNLTPVFLEDKIDGTDVAAVPWVEVARALRQARKCHMNKITALGEKLEALINEALRNASGAVR